jgi:hypothetical protein
VAIYSGDSNYAGSTGSAEPLTINQGTSSTSTTIVDASGGSVTHALGESVKDTATLTGSSAAFTPTGTVVYEFFTTANHGTGAHTDQTVTLANGTVPNSNTTGALGAGAYSYVAIYSGDSNYTGSTGSVEPLTINKGTSSTSTTMLDANGGPVTGDPGENVQDTATVTATPFTPSGTVVYEFFTTGNGTGPHTDQTVTLVNGTVPNSNVNVGLFPDTYSYVAIYSGDKNYTGSAGAFEPFTIRPGPPVGQGDAAGIGYWQSNNGQSLILQDNKGLSNPSTKLASWLVSEFPNVFGHYLSTSSTNQHVANLYLQFFHAHGPKAYAQYMAVALAVYFTDSNLGGGAASLAEGFNVSAAGTGSNTFNVGSDGAALGVPDNSTLTVFKMLQDVNKYSANGVLEATNPQRKTLGLATLQTMVNDLFGAINDAGGI